MRLPFAFPASFTSLSLLFVRARDLAAVARGEPTVAEWERAGEAAEAHACARRWRILCGEVHARARTAESEAARLRGVVFAAEAEALDLGGTIAGLRATVTSQAETIAGSRRQLAEAARLLDVSEARADVCGRERDALRPSAEDVAAAKGWALAFTTGALRVFSGSESAAALLLRLAGVKDGDS